MRVATLWNGSLNRRVQGLRRSRCCRAEENPPGERPAPKEVMWDQVGQLYAYHGDVPAEVRLLKLTEEVGD